MKGIGNYFQGRCATCGKRTSYSIFTTLEIKRYCKRHFKEAVLTLSKESYLTLEYAELYVWSGKQSRNFWRGVFWNKNRQVLPKDSWGWIPDRYT